MDDREKQQLPQEEKAPPNVPPSPEAPAAPTEVEPPTQQFSTSLEPSPMSNAAAKENQPFEAPPTAPKPKRKGMIIAIIVAAALVVLTGGSALAYNFWYQNPNKVVGDALMNALEAKFVSLEGTADFSEGSNRKASIVFDGGNNEGASALNMKASVSMDGRDYSFGGGLFADAKGTLYFKVNGVRDIVKDFRGQLPPASLPPFDKLVKKIDDRWISLKASDTKEFSESYSRAQKCLAESAKKLRDDNNLRTEVIDAYKKNVFIKVEKSLGSKDGSLGYELSIDNTKVKDFNKAFKETTFFKDMHKCDPGFNVDDPVESEAAGKVKTTTEVWVSRWSHEVTKLAVDVSEDGQKGSIVLEPTFNKAKELKAPENAITMQQLKADIDELVQSIMAPTFAPAAPSSQPMSSDSDLFS